jgi:hypothetical protein
MGLIEPYSTFREVRSNILRLPGCEIGHSPQFSLSRLRMCELHPHCLIRLHGAMINEAYAQVYIRRYVAHKACLIRRYNLIAEI